jgi:uncharacterized membrane protein
MVGFAVASFRENGWRGLISQGLGTSMLQIPNLVNHPLILVPQVISSLIMGPIATCAFGLECVSAASGMGTAGLVGLFGTIEGSQGVIPNWRIGVGILICHFLGPIVLSIVLSEVMRKFGWIKPGDQLLPMPVSVHKGKEDEEAKEMDNLVDDVEEVHDDSSPERSSL